MPSSRPIQSGICRSSAFTPTPSGIGLQLMQPVLARADSTGVASYLETAQPCNSAYYLGVGFQELGPAAPLRPGGPPMTRMIRPI